MKRTKVDKATLAVERGKYKASLINRFYWERDNASKKQRSRSFFKKYLWVLRDLCGEANFFGMEVFSLSFC
jgi:hypothetical protein